MKKVFVYSSEIKEENGSKVLYFCELRFLSITRFIPLRRYLLDTPKESLKRKPEDVYSGSPNLVPTSQSVLRITCQEVSTLSKVILLNEENLKCWTFPIF